MDDQWFFLTIAGGMVADRDPFLLPKPALQRLIEVLEQAGYRVVAPVVAEGAALWRTIHRVADLPVGWRDGQEPGRYRLEQTDASEIFSLVHGPQSVKPLAFAPREPLITIDRRPGDHPSRVHEPPHEQIAVLGARACDVAGLLVQDRVMLQGAHVDPYYHARRFGLFLIVVNCTRALPVCFCASVGTGPRATSGYDLALTELDEGLLIEAGSEAGGRVLDALELSPAPQTVVREAVARVEACARSQTRQVDRARFPHELYAAQDHSRWNEVGSRCLACGNCTMVCPTCFCHTVEEVPDLASQTGERVRLWDSCFTQDHGAIHGKNLRPTITDRYRMWLTHKWASWFDQFGSSGCVGCGRCLTWCPVGIDLTEELAVLTGQNTERPEPSR